jgi:hypothetical protein
MLLRGLCGGNFYPSSSQRILRHNPNDEVEPRLSVTTGRYDGSADRYVVTEREIRIL